MNFTNTLYAHVPCPDCNKAVPPKTHHSCTGNVVIELDENGEPASKYYEEARDE